MQRLRWEALPDAVRRAVTEQTGDITKIDDVTTGRNSGVAAVLHTASGRVFVKGLPSDHPQVRTQEREAAINPYVEPVSPRLIWRFQTCGWDLLGFDHIAGRPADLSPGFSDLPGIAATLSRLNMIPLPDLPLPRASQRWSDYLDETSCRLLDGEKLLHTDLNAGNIIIDERAHLVDWAWPTQGAAWIDPACLIVWLIAEGHTPPQAERWAACLPSWTTAPARAVDTFALAQHRMWEQIARDDPQSWKSRVAHAARRWHDHRSGKPAATQ